MKKYREDWESNRTASRKFSKKTKVKFCKSCGDIITNKSCYCNKKKREYDEDNR